MDKDLLLINRQDYERLSELKTMSECVAKAYMQVIKHGEYDEEDLMRLADAINFFAPLSRRHRGVRRSANRER